MLLLGSALAIAGLLSTACGDTVQVGLDLASAGSNAGGASGAAGNGGGASGTAGGGTAGTPGVISCLGHIYQCGDGLDDDNDGLIDAQDPDCLGPCDNTEDSYYGGIPGQNNSPCRQDCYFDQDTGTGNDDCFWSQSCDPLSKPPDYPPSGDNKCAYNENVTIPGTLESCSSLRQAQSQTCADYCGPLTPNGCDCFGCCELPAGSGKYVWLGSTDNAVGSCDAANVGDPTKCHPCTPVKSCFNDCGPCEVCIGRSKVPSSCKPDSGAGRQCAPGDQKCGQPGEAPCPANFYCITGCCKPIPA